MPKLSVIIATHSRPHLLPRAVKSAFEGGDDIEVIVVDDASKDDTAEVCKNLQGIKYVRLERNQHTSGARNIGILASSAPYISFLDDDDWRLPDSYTEQIELLEQNPGCGLVYGQFLQANQAGDVLDDLPVPQVFPEGDVFWKMLEYNYIGCLTAVFRKECIYKVGMLDTSFPGVDDWDLWIRIAELYELRAVQKPVAVWRSADQTSNQGSSNVTNLYLMAAKLLVAKWLNLPRVKQELSAQEIKRKKELILSNISGNIVTDAAYTLGRYNKLSKLKKAVSLDSKILTTPYFYKILLKSL